MANTFDINTAGTREVREETRDRFGSKEIAAWFNGRARISDQEPINRQSDMHDADWRACYVDLSETLKGETVTLEEPTTKPEPKPEPTTKPEPKPEPGLSDMLSGMRGFGMDRAADQIQAAVDALTAERDKAAHAAETAKAEAQTAIAKAKATAAVPVAPSKPGQHVAQVVKTVNAADLFPGSGSILRNRNIMLDVCDDPTAPDPDPNYLWNADTPDMLAALSAGLNVLAFGAKGTGKSSAARNLAGLLGRPYFQIGFHAETSSAELFGFMGPDTDGGMSWVPGDLLTAMQTPHAVIDLSEISFARPELTAQLFSVLEPTDRTVTVGGTKYHAHPTVWFIGTSNDNGSGELSHRYHGTRPMNPALVSRFGFRVEFKSPAQKRLAKMLAKAAGVPLAVAEPIAQFEKEIEKGVTAGDCEDTPGVRSAIAWAVMVKAGTPSKRAFEFAVLNSAPSEDAAYWAQRAAALDPHAQIDRAHGNPTAHADADDTTDADAIETPTRAGFTPTA